MTITYREKPTAGKVFYLSVSEISGTADISFRIGERILHKVGCPDPPCHESVFLTRELAGQTLTVDVRSASGEEETRSFRIAATEVEGGAMVASH